MNYYGPLNSVNCTVATKIIGGIGADSVPVTYTRHSTAAHTHTDNSDVAFFLNFYSSVWTPKTDHNQKQIGSLQFNFFTVLTFLCCFV